MSWNDGYERRKFEAGQKKQAEEYRALGMTEEQIQAMYEFDLEQYKSDRCHYSHTQSFIPDDFLTTKNITGTASMITTAAPANQIQENSPSEN